MNSVADARATAQGAREARGRPSPDYSWRDGGPHGWHGERGAPRRGAPADEPPRVENTSPSGRPHQPHAPGREHRGAVRRGRTRAVRDHRCLHE